MRFARSAASSAACTAALRCPTRRASIARNRRTRRKRTKPCGRPSAARAPEQLAGKLEADEHKLYTLIWRRAVASQMEAAVYDTVAVDLAAGAGNSVPRERLDAAVRRVPRRLSRKHGRRRANRTTTRTACCRRSKPATACKLLAIDTAQHFTEPPPRYSEASLVKALEEHGIGRPSTYASIIQTLLYKKYCELVNRRFVPTDLGKIVSRFLTGNFERYVDYGFTAAMEDELDNISRGEEEWVPVLERFWVELKKQIDDVTENVTRSDVAMARDIGIDPVSGRPVSVRFGRFGAFAQIGTRDDEDKPKFASLRPHQRMDDLTLADALDLFQLPRTLGEWDDGHPIKVAIGRFGPYVQYGAKKYASLKKEDDPYTVTLERARAGHPRKAGDRGESHHQGIPRGRHPGLERPLRSVHQRRQEERQDPEGSRSEVADASTNARRSSRRRRSAPLDAGAARRAAPGLQRRRPTGEDNEEVATKTAGDVAEQRRERRVGVRQRGHEEDGCEKKKAGEEKDYQPGRKPRCEEARVVTGALIVIEPRPLRVRGRQQHAPRHAVRLRRNHVPARAAGQHYGCARSCGRQRCNFGVTRGSAPKAVAANRA